MIPGKGSRNTRRTRLRGQGIVCKPRQRRKLCDQMISWPERLSHSYLRAEKDAVSPLTRYRPKPLVPFGGYRIADFALSNCLNSGLNRACLITQPEDESISSYLRKRWRRAGEGDRKFGLSNSWGHGVAPVSGERYAGTVGTVDALLKKSGTARRRTAAIFMCSRMALRLFRPITLDPSLTKICTGSRAIRSFVGASRASRKP